jgi:hypothetical protein
VTVTAVMMPSKGWKVRAQLQANSALLTDALGLQLRCAHRAAKRER